MSNCSTLTCQIDGRITPVAPSGAPASAPGNPSGACAGRGRSSGRRGGGPAAAPRGGFLEDARPTPAPAPAPVPALAQPTPAPSPAPLPVRQPPGAVLVTPALPPPGAEIPLWNGIGYPEPPRFVGGVPVGAVPTIPGYVGTDPTTLTGVPAAPALDAGKGTPAPHPALMTPAAIQNATGGSPAAQPPLAVGGKDAAQPAPQPALMTPAAVQNATGGAPSPASLAAAPPPMAAAPGASAPTLELDAKEKQAFIVRPSGAPLDQDACHGAFLGLPMLDQARVFEDGRLGNYAFARAVASDLRRGFSASARAGADWVFSTFPRQSPEFADFCAAVRAFAPPPAPAGAAFAADFAAQRAGARPYVAPKALPGRPALQYADESAAHLEALHAVAPFMFGRALADNRFDYTRPDGSAAVATLADNQYTRDIVRALLDPSTPYERGAALRGQYIAMLRRALAESAGTPRGELLRGCVRALYFYSNPATVKGLPGKPAGEVDMDFSADASVPGSSAYDPWAGLRGGGLGPARDNATGVTYDPATGQPVQQQGVTGAQVMGGVGQIAQQGFGVLGAYLTGEAQRDAARYTADAQRTAAQAAAQSAAEVARINADRDIALARLTAEMRAAQQAGASAAETSGLGAQIAALQAQIAASASVGPQQAQQPPQDKGLSTGAMVGIGVAGVGVVGGVVYLLTRRKHNGARRRRRLAA